MNKLDFGQAVTTIVNLGVIAGLVFLALELGETNALMEIQARATRLGILKESSTARLDYPELRRAFSKVREGSELTDDEREVVRLYYINLFHNFDYVYEDYKAGIADERDLRVDGWRAFYRAGPDSDAIWAATRDAFDPDFVAWFEQNIIAD